MLAALHKLVELPMGTLSAGEMLVHLAKVIKTRRDDSVGVCVERAQASSCSGEHLTAELRTRIKQLEEEKDQVEGDQRDVINDLTKANGQLNVFVTKLRDRVRARDVELTCKADELDAMRAQLAEKDAKSGEREASTDQETVVSLTAQNAQLEKDIAALREEAHSRDANLCSKDVLITILEKKCFEKEDAMIRAVKERDAARAKNNNFDKSQAKIARITTELVKYKTSSERYKEEAEKSNELVKKYNNDGKACPNLHALLLSTGHRARRICALTSSPAFLNSFLNSMAQRRSCTWTTFLCGSRSACTGSTPCPPIRTRNGAQR
ncbi:hypothetical protein FOMPIDRAFT_128306 [Fomitopsis schrenkii]|uniref:Uncharacterized protein n=1 Tax=Fomitopsis schrenkii TaxID=2126942 RepID=S8F4J3_FOMSC|nr:hypothetical protein FOMPIDRAFT_128306 [Fomitopsis schrenkii]